MKVNWKYKYFEKKNNESHAYIFKNLEIKHYIQKYLKNHGLILHNFKLCISGSTLNLCISIYETERAHLMLRNKLKKINQLQKNLKQHSVLNKYLINKEVTINSNTSKIIKKKLNKIFKKKIGCIFSKQNLLKSLNLFTNYKFNINLKVNQINNVKHINNTIENSNKKQSVELKNLKEKPNMYSTNQKLIIFRLRKFEKTSFYKEGKHLFLPLVTQQNSTYLLATFIATQLKNLKQHKFFFNFIKESLRLTICQKFSKIQGLKILIKGRLNNAARAKHKIIILGKIPLLKIKSKIDYSQSTAFTINGTFGIKVWICYR